MSVNEETVSTLPFFSLSDRDFNHFLGNWSVPNLNEAVDLFDLFPNPDKGDESDPDLMLASPCSEYYSINNLNKLTRKSGPNLSLYFLWLGKLGSGMPNQTSNCKDKAE